ncbi:MAG: spore cortex biosynthesis protein YabQ [Clostridia bacterium]|nr:spore cortex biosynthesis protein YabQ [Clostridia bacterium]
MGFTLLSQQTLFLLSLLFGGTLSAVYCVFRIVRNIFLAYPISAFIFDLLYFLITAISTVVFIFVANNGEIRIYVIASVCLGWILFFLTFGRFISFIVRKCTEKFRKKCRKDLK